MIIPRKKATIKITLIPSSKKLSVNIRHYTNATIEMTPRQRVEVINSEGFMLNGKEILINEITDAIDIALKQLCTMKDITVETEHQAQIYS